MQTAIQSMVVIRRNHKQVDTFVHKTVYLQALAFVVVVGVLYYHLHIIVVEVLRREHLYVGFIAPRTAYALRYTYLIFIVGGATAERNKRR